MTSRIYLAARFSRKDELCGYRDELNALGFTVTSRWLLGGHEFVGVPDHEIPPHHNARFAEEDLVDIDSAEIVVCFTEPQGSKYGRGGRHVEMGYAIAKHKTIIVVQYRENVFTCLDEILFVDTWEEAKDLIQTLG